MSGMSVQGVAHSLTAWGERAKDNLNFCGVKRQTWKRDFVSVGYLNRAYYCFIQAEL